MIFSYYILFQYIFRQILQVIKKENCLKTLIGIQMLKMMKKALNQMKIALTLITYFDVVNKQNI